MLKRKSLRYYLPAILILATIGLISSLAVIFDKFTFVPKILIVLVIVFVALITRSLRALLNEWYIYIAFVYLFDSFRGLIYINICKSGYPVFALYAYNLEKAIFGFIPSIKLQEKFILSSDQIHFGWIEKLVTFLHGSHFLAFLLVGLAIWVYKRNLFNFYKISFYQLISLGLLNYFLIPTAPPWLLSNFFHLDSPLIRFNRIIYNYAIPDISSAFDSNPVAAMPSLHAAFPILCSMLLWKAFGWKAILFVFYSLALIFGIVYTGDHYFVDILAGFILALFCFLATPSIIKLLQKIKEARSYRFLRSTQENNTINQSKVIAGTFLLFFGIALGSFNLNEFINNQDYYNLYTPRFIDFLDSKKEYANNFSIQFYLGNHYLVHGHPERAVPYLQKSLSLAKDEKDIKRAMESMDMAKRMLNKINRTN